MGPITESILRRYPSLVKRVRHGTVHTYIPCKIYKIQTLKHLDDGSTVKIERWVKVLETIDTDDRLLQLILVSERV